jgi:hypothetical protein
MHIIICIVIHSSVCELRFMQPAFRPNSGEVACTKEKVERACSRYHGDEFIHGAIIYYVL